MAKERGKRRHIRHDPAFRLKVVQAHLSGKFSFPELKKLYGVDRSTVWGWKSRFETEGEAGLRDRPSGKRPKTPGPATRKLRASVLDVKRKFPVFGIAKLLHWIRRTLFLPVSYRFVRKTLK